MLSGGFHSIGTVGKEIQLRNWQIELGYWFCFEIIRYYHYIYVFIIISSSSRSSNNVTMNVTDWALDPWTAGFAHFSLMEATQIKIPSVKEKCS